MELVQEDEYADSDAEKKSCTEVLRIHIIDSGVGMDEECLKALAVIGTGWSGRKKYFEEIGRMPIWMQPTGSFGIGIQSGFMMTNRIRIIVAFQEGISKVFSLTDKLHQRTSIFLQYDELRMKWEFEQVKDPERLNEYIQRMLDHTSDNP